MKFLTSQTLFLTALFLGLSACKNSNDKISGTIDIVPELQSRLSSSAVLYIIARSEGQTSGPPVAVKRFTQPLVFPIEFNLSKQDTMVPDSPFEGRYTVSARIAQAGSATPVKTGDLEGRGNPSSVAVGEKNLKITLNQVH